MGLSFAIDVAIFLLDSLKKSVVHADVLSDVPGMHFFCSAPPQSIDWAEALSPSSSSRRHSFSLAYRDRPLRWLPSCVRAPR